MVCTLQTLSGLQPVAQYPPALLPTTYPFRPVARCYPSTHQPYCRRLTHFDRWRDAIPVPTSLIADDLPISTGGEMLSQYPPALLPTTYPFRPVARCYPSTHQPYCRRLTHFDRWRDAIPVPTSLIADDLPISTGGEMIAQYPPALLPTTYPFRPVARCYPSTHQPYCRRLTHFDRWRDVSPVPTSLIADDLPFSTGGEMLAQYPPALLPTTYPSRPVAR